jgi:hypothetical protein
MTYSKPEVAVLGEAGALIQGSIRTKFQEPHSQLQQVVSDCEFDD